MAWIESHQTLGNHPKTRKAARLLNTTVPAVVGHLHLLWWWALDYAQDGDISGFADADLADVAQWKKDPATFVAGLLGAGLTADRPGFLERTEDGRLLIHDWWEYSGRLLDRRRRDAERKQDIRQTSSGRPADVLRTSNGRRTDGVRTVPNQPNRTVPNPTAGGADAPAPALGDVLGTITMALPHALRDVTLYAECEQLAADFPDVTAVSRAIEEARRTPRADGRPRGKLWPSDIREFLTSDEDKRKAVLNGSRHSTKPAPVVDEYWIGPLPGAR